MPRATAIALLLPALLSLTTAATARQAGIGDCTRRDEFQARQEKIDPFIQQLCGLPDGRKKQRAAAAIAKKFGSGQMENLIRYREPDVALVFAELLEHKKWYIRARALYGLKMVGGDVAREGAARLLEDKEPMVREAAANTLCHVGDADSAALLEKRLEKESDPLVGASMQAAIDVLKSGERYYDGYGRDQPFQEVLVGPEGARRVEYQWKVKGASAFNAYDAKAHELPVAETFSYPVSWYKDSLFASYPRNSFGAGGNHAAEDCAWFREGCSYYAIADGVVRMVQGAGGDWGFLVVLEHRLASGEYIVSLYGHSAWDVLVRPGDEVRCGQKIATQGLSCSVENGGYGSHVHFGLGDGPFRRPKGLVKGQTLEWEEDGRRLKGTLVAFGYSEEKRDQYGNPSLEVVVETAPGQRVIRPMPDEAPQDQVAWMQAYIKDCVGWLNPQTWLPEHVEPPRKKR